MANDLSKLASSDVLAQIVNDGVAYTLDFVTALAILIAGIVLSNWVQRALLRSLGRVKGFDETLRRVIGRIAKYAVLVFVVVLVLAQFGVQTTSIIAVLGAAGLAIGLALQGTLANIAAGFMLLFLRPFKVGDYIDADGIAGTVREIGLFVTELNTSDGIYIAAPNSKIWNATITNYSRLPTRRIALAVGIAYEDDIDRGLKVLGAVVGREKRVLDKPPPKVFVRSLDDSAVTLEIRAWTRRQDYADVLADLTRAVKTACDKAGLSIPYPQTDVHLKRGD